MHIIKVSTPPKYGPFFRLELKRNDLISMADFKRFSEFKKILKCVKTKNGRKGPQLCGFPG